MYIPPIGPLNARIAIVGEKPGEDELRKGEPFVGASGLQLNELLVKNGTNRNQVYITNAVKNVQKVGNPTREEIEAELPTLYKELTNLKNLNVIVPMGANALQALSNFQLKTIGSYRGSILPTFFSRKMVPTYHPAFYMRGEWRFKPVVKFDLGRAIEESYASTINVPQRKCFIAQTISDVREIGLQFSSTRHISFDIELLRGRFIECIAFSSEPNSAYCIPFTTIHRRSIFNPTDELEAWRIVQQILNQKDTIYVTQNGLFDCWHLWRHGIQTPYMAQGCDTMLMHRLRAPDLPHDLGFLVSIYTREPYYKDESGDWTSQIRTVDQNTFWAYNCVEENTKVLTDNLHWKTIKDIQVGDYIIAADEYTKGFSYSRWTNRVRVIKKSEPITKALIRIKTSTGELDITKDHLILSYEGRQEGWQWIEASKLTIGKSQLPKLLIWEPIETFQSGWLCGLVDGEGSISQYNGTYPTVTFSQRPGKVLDKATKLLEELGIYYTISSSNKSAHYVYIRGGLAGTFKFLGSIRPERLINRFITYATEGLSGFSGIIKEEVLSISDAGEGVVYDITTENGTFFANGYTVHNCKDAATTLEVAFALEKDLAKHDQLTNFKTEIQKQWSAVTKMRQKGIKVDPVALQSAREALSREIAAEEQLIKTTLGWLPNTKSPIDMEKVYNELKIQFQRTASGRAKTDIEQLYSHAYTNPTHRQVLYSIAGLNAKRTLQSGFVNFPLDDVGNYHPSLDISKTKTGRVASKGADEGGPQIQNITKRLRNIFIPDDKESEITNADLAGAEAMLVAWFSRDPLMIEAFVQGLKIHKVRGCIIYRNWNQPTLPPRELLDSIKLVCPDCAKLGEKECNHSEYYMSKQSGHAMAYREGPRRFCHEQRKKGIFISEATAKELRLKVITSHLHNWHLSVEADLRRTPWLITPLGRKREFYGQFDDTLINQALSWLCQATVGQITNRAMIWLDEKITSENLPVRLLTQTHDSLTVSNRIHYHYVVRKLLHQAFHQPMTIHGRELLIPIEITSGPNWRDLK